MIEGLSGGWPQLEMLQLVHHPKAIRKKRKTFVCVCVCVCLFLHLVKLCVVCRFRVQLYEAIFNLCFIACPAANAVERTAGIIWWDKNMELHNSLQHIDLCD